MLKTTIIIILLTTSTTLCLKNCTNITEKIVSNPHTLYPYDFTFTINELKAGRNVDKKTISLATTSNDKLYHLTVFPFLIQSDDRKTFEEDLNAYFDKQKHKYTNMVFISDCFYYESEVTVVFLFTEFILPLRIEPSAEVTAELKLGLHQFNTQQIISAIDITSIIESYHNEGKILLMISPQLFYKRYDYQGNVKYMYLENYYSLLTNNDNKSDGYCDPFILLKDFETNKCSDVYALGMILNSMFYGELSFDDILSCKLNTFDAEECAIKKYEKIYNLQEGFKFINYNVSANPNEQYMLNELKLHIDMLIRMLVKPECNKRLSASFAAHELTRIYNNMKGVPKNPINYPIININEQFKILDEYINKLTDIIEQLFDRWNVVKLDEPKALNNVNIATKTGYPKTNDTKNVKPQKLADSNVFYHVPVSDIEIFNHYGEQDVKAQQARKDVSQFYPLGYDYNYQQPITNNPINGNNVVIQQYQVYTNTGYTNAANPRYLQQTKMRKIL